MPCKATGAYTLPQNQLLITTSNLLRNGCNDVPLVPVMKSVENLFKLFISTSQEAFREDSFSTNRPHVSPGE
jgi:hypothetical protein